MGDLQMDMDLGKAVGCPAILIRDGAVVDSTNAEASLIVPDLLEAARIVIDGELDKMCRERARGSASASC
jgi:hypothetical protein